MKLIRWGNAGAEKPGLILKDGRSVVVPVEFGDYDESFFANGRLEELKAWAESEAERAPEIPPGARQGPPICRPSKIICVGLNYSDHAAESGMPVPAEPVLFFKSTTAFQGPNDDLEIPTGSTKTDWEVELALVIGKKAKRVAKTDALDYLAGYVLHNDYSEREWQLEKEGQWVKGKSADTFAPCGPWLATTDEIPDPGNLHLWLKVNGETKQQGNTSKFIFDVPTVVSYISNFMTLLPGDIISTGTPPGVGLGFNPPQYLKPGDVIELGIDGLGTQRQTAVAEPG
ncbi:MAG: fumarylacetoacetate hydrolase family protein [Synoicihabitans sp.]